MRNLVRHDDPVPGIERHDQGARAGDGVAREDRVPGHAAEVLGDREERQAREEQGQHEELLARGGFYADLYNSQFENTDVSEAA